MAEALTEIRTYDNTQYVAHGSNTNNLMVYVAKKIPTAQGSVQTQRTYGSNTRIPYCRSGQYLSLMYLGEKLGVEVDCSTKCHPELAGEGIEYTWGQAKGVYRRARLSQKKGRTIFESLWKTAFHLEKEKVRVHCHWR